LDKGDTRTKTNDVLQVFNSLTYGGLLIMTNLGSAPLTIGDRFQLFSGTNYSGAFSAMNLPRPGPGLNWANKLLLDGSIELVPWSGPRIDSISVSGTNLFLRITDGLLGGAYEVLASTNIATPLTNWTILSSGTFDWLGTTTITNAITAGEPERFFRARIP